MAGGRPVDTSGRPLKAGDGCLGIGDDPDESGEAGITLETSGSAAIGSTSDAEKTDCEYVGIVHVEAPMKLAAVPELAKNAGIFES